MIRLTSYEMTLQEIRKFGHRFNQENSKCEKCNMIITIESRENIKFFTIKTVIGMKCGYIDFSGVVRRNWFVCESVKCLL